MISSKELAEKISLYIYAKDHKISELVVDAPTSDKIVPKADKTWFLKKSGAQQFLCFEFLAINFSNRVT